MDPVVLVTGANGFVGRHIVDRLARSGAWRIVATDMHDHLIALHGDPFDSITYVSGDLADTPFVESLRHLERIDAVIHLAANISKSTDITTYFSIMNSNINATFLLLEAAKEHGARFLFPSTALVYGNQPTPFAESMPPQPQDFYAMSKHMSEQLITFYHTKYRLRALIFRIGILYGPGQGASMFIPSLVECLLHNRPFNMTKGEQTRDFVYIDDFVDAVEAALARPQTTGTVNIGSGSAPSMREVALTAQELCEKTDLVAIGVLPYRDNEVLDYRLDSTLARSILGWKPHTDLRTGLARIIEYEQQREQSAS